jgi:hypothetical protein
MSSQRVPWTGPAHGAQVSDRPRTVRGAVILVMRKAPVPRLVSGCNRLYVWPGHLETVLMQGHQARKARLDRAIECRLAEVGQPSGSLAIIREPSALTLIVPAPARFSCS